MGKVLRIFVVLLFLLSIAALVLGVQLFGRREELKGRTQKLEAGVLEVSRRLTAPREPHIAAIPQRIDAVALQQYDQMDGPLRLVETLVDTRTEELFTTSGQLRETRDQLTQVRQELVRVREDLQRAQERVAQLQRDVEAKDAEIVRLRRDITEKDGVIAQREATIEGLNADVARLREAEDEQRHTIERLEQVIANMGGSETDITRDIPPGLAGRVILVEPEWNFVILDIGADSGLMPNVELLVHREEEYVGRIRVITVRDHIAVADIQREAKMMPLLEGDSVFFPGG